MAQPIKLHALRVSEVRLRAYRRDLILTKMDFLLWGWNWTSKAIGRCADDDGDLTFDSESVRVTREEERAYVALFKHPCSGKNGYRTVWYHDQLRRNVAMALMQIPRPSRPTYMMTWHVGFVERALRGDRIHWTRIFRTTTRQHIWLIPEESTCHLSSFLINFYRGMGILTPVENRDFPPREVPQEGKEVVLANEVNSDLEVKPRNSLKQRRKRSRGRQDSQPRKSRSIDEAAVVEERLRRAAPIEMRSPDFWARSKMKVMRLILEEYSSTESRRAATRGCSVQEAGPVAITDTEKEVSVEKKPRTTEEQSKPVKPHRASKKDKGKAVLIEEVPLRQVEVPSEGIRMKAPRERAHEVQTVSSDTEEDPMALEEVAAKVVEDVEAAECGSQKVASPRTSTEIVILKTGEEPSAEESQSQALGVADVLCVHVLLLLQYLDRKRDKYAYASTNGSYVEIIHNRTRTKVEVVAEVATKERKSQPTKARY